MYEYYSYVGYTASHVHIEKKVLKNKAQILLARFPGLRWWEHSAMVLAVKLKYFRRSIIPYKTTHRSSLSCST